MTDGVEGPRYLVAFGPKRVPHCFTDVLILGVGSRACGRRSRSTRGFPSR